MILNKMKAGYNLGKERGCINHLLFMDDIKLYGKDTSELDSLIQTVRIFSGDVGMEFGIQKCAMLSMRRGKMVECEGIELPNEEKIKSVGEDGYKYLGILQSDEIKNKKMKETIEKEYFRRIRKILKSKLNGGNTIQSINSRAVSIIRYGAGIIEWNKAELKRIDRKTRKLLTIYKIFHPQGDVDGLYWKRSEGGRGLLSVEECVEMEATSLAYYMEAKEEKLLKEVVKEGLLPFKRSPKEKKKELMEKRKNTYLAKDLHPVYEKNTKEIKDEETSWLWLKKGFLKKETEGTILAAQDQALRTNYIKKHIDKMDVSPMCRMCGKRNENISHIISECEDLAQKEYKIWRHDKVAAIIHWDLCGKYGFCHSSKHYEHVVTKENKVLENKEVKILRDFPIQTDHKLEHNKPDIVIMEKGKRICYIIDVACPFDTRVKQK